MQWITAKRRSKWRPKGNGLFASPEGAKFLRALCVSVFGPFSGTTAAGSLFRIHGHRGGLADAEGDGWGSFDVDPHREAVREADPVDGLADIGEELDGRAVGDKNAPGDTVHDAGEGFAFMAHEADADRPAFGDMAELGFFEIGGDPERTGIHQGKQLLAGVNVGARRGVDIGEVAIDRRDDAGVAEIELGEFEAGLCCGGVGLGGGKGILRVLQVAEVVDLGLEQRRLALEFLLGLDDRGLGLREFGGPVVHLGLERGGIDLKEEVALFDDLVVADGDLHDGSLDPAGDADDVRPHLRVAGPRARDIARIHRQRCHEGERDHDGGNEVLAGGKFHGAKINPITQPKNTARATKNKGRCQIWRVQPFCSRARTRNHAARNPSEPMTMPQGTRKSPN